VKKTNEQLARPTRQQLRRRRQPVAGHPSPVEAHIWVLRRISKLKLRSYFMNDIKQMYRAAPGLVVSVASMLAIGLILGVAAAFLT
jgi:hypothetical protein